MTFEKFYGTIMPVGNSKGLLIPANIVKGAGYKEGDKLIVMIKKKPQNE